MYISARALLRIAGGEVWYLDTVIDSNDLLNWATESDLGRNPVVNKAATFKIGENITRVETAYSC